MDSFEDFGDTAKLSADLLTTPQVGSGLDPIVDVAGAEANVELGPGASVSVDRQPPQGVDDEVDLFELFDDDSDEFVIDVD